MTALCVVHRSVDGVWCEHLHQLLSAGFGRAAAHGGCGVTGSRPHVLRLVSGHGLFVLQPGNARGDPALASGPSHPPAVPPRACCGVLHEPEFTTASETAVMMMMMIMWSTFTCTSSTAWSGNEFVLCVKVEMESAGWQMRQLHQLLKERLTQGLQNLSASLDCVCAITYFPQGF